MLCFFSCWSLKTSICLSHMEKMGTYFVSICNVIFNTLKFLRNYVPADTCSPSVVKMWTVRMPEQNTNQLSVYWVSIIYFRQNCILTNLFDHSMCFVDYFLFCLIQMFIKKWNQDKRWYTKVLWYCLHCHQLHVYMPCSYHLWL